MGMAPQGLTTGERLVPFGEEQVIWQVPSIFFQWHSLFSRRKHSPEEYTSSTYSPAGKKLFINCISSADTLIPVA